MAEWSDWIQGVAGKALDTAIEVKYKQPYELQRMQLAAMSPFGNPYLEGQANQPASAQAQGIAGIPPIWLLVGAVVAVIALAD